MRILLETLPGWPTAEEPSLFMWLLVLLAIPAAIGLVIMAIGMAGRWRRTDPTLTGGAHPATTADEMATDVRRSIEQARIGAVTENQQIDTTKVPDPVAITAH